MLAPASVSAVAEQIELPRQETGCSAPGGGPPCRPKTPRSHNVIDSVNSAGFMSTKGRRSGSLGDVSNKNIKLQQREAGAGKYLHKEANPAQISRKVHVCNTHLLVSAQTPPVRLPVPSILAKIEAEWLDVGLWWACSYYSWKGKKKLCNLQFI